MERRQPFDLPDREVTEDDVEEGNVLTSLDWSAVWERAVLESKSVESESKPEYESDFPSFGTDGYNRRTYSNGSQELWYWQHDSLFVRC
jgi:hypothetical protein